MGALNPTMPNSIFPLTPASLPETAHAYPLPVRKALELAAHLRRGRLDVHMPDGKVMRVDNDNTGPGAEMYVRDLRFARRLVDGGDVGIAEAYFHGEWDTPNLVGFLELFCSNQHVMAKLMEGKPVLRFLQMVRHWLRANTKSGAKRNIHAHYDLGNAFYSAWLDPSMTYSSALYNDKTKTLTEAQTEKYRALARDMGLESGKSVLEIGCGWGGFAEVAARDFDCRVTGLTISREQFDFAQKRMFEAGLNEKVEIKYQDYRDETGTYDRIASIEMFEAVGESYWPTYFRQLHDRLNAGGKAGLQVITIDEGLFSNYRREMDFIRRYIFPGGMLPTNTILRDLGIQHGLKPTGERAFGLDYARTLAEWRVSFLNAWPKLTELGFDERFRRLWEYYLAYCEAGFRVGTIDVRQVVFAKP